MRSSRVNRPFFRRFRSRGRVPDANDGTGNVFVVDQSGTLTAAGVLNVTANATIGGGTSLGGGEVTVASGVTLMLDGATFANTGLSIAATGALTVEAGSSFQGVDVYNSGVINADDATLTVDVNSVIVNTGTLEVTAGGTLAISSNVGNDGGVIDASGNRAHSPVADDTVKIG
jgi:hypothetical protein